MSRLSEASLRINESLEFGEVLQGALDSARALTGAAYAVMFLMDDRGEPGDYLSSGMTGEQDSLLWEMAGAWEFFDFLSGIDEALRVDDFQGYLRARGCRSSCRRCR